MEIKHTIEILTKDIQDIENLVRNLKKTPTPSRIEIDLAMSKLRNVYELLSIISEDIRSDHAMKAEGGTPTSPEAPATETAADPAPTATEETVQEEKNQEKSTVDAPPRKEAEEKASPDPDIGEPDTTEGAGKAEKQEETVRQEPPVNHSAKKEEKQEEKPAQNAEKVTAEEDRKTQIVAEKFAANKNINEKIAPGSDRDLTAKLTGEPIDSIKRHIGINDRFMIIRELLNGDNEKFNKVVGELDSCSNFDEAMQIIEKEFSGKTDHEGVTLITRLARRRYMGQ